MKIESIRGEFKVYTVVPEKVAPKGDVYQFLNDAGFSARHFSTAEAVLANLLQEPPHVVISYLDLPQMDGLEFLENIQKMSDDILVLIVASDESDKDKAFQKGAYNVIDKDIKENYLINLLDKAIHQLYLKFQNEQLLEELDHQIQSNLKTSVEDEKTDNVEIRHSAESLSDNEVSLNTNKKINRRTVDMINNFITKLSIIDSADDIVDCFIDNISNLVDRPAIYLKYIPSHSSLLITHTCKLNMNEFKNAGIPLEEEPQSYLAKIKSPGTFQQLQNFMLNIFQIESYFSIPIVINKNILGLIVIFDTLEDQSEYIDLIDSYIHVFKIFVEKAYFQEKAQNLIVSDLHTGAYNKKFFMKILDQEMHRAYRIKHPLSLLYIDIDDFDSYVKRNGEQVGHVLLRMISHAFIKTSRKTDWVSKWKNGEFVVLLPHTDKESAMIKAERLRRMIHNAKLPYGQHQPLGYLSISVGISEYPSLSWDATSLIQVADNALYQAKKSTKNRACLGAASKDFKPDFEVISAVQS